MEVFKLPRLDWYDSDGRIYKDALIENFNAIEEAFLELQSLGNLEIEDVNWNNVHLADVTLSSDNNKIVNLRSLINILKLDSMCFNESFTGKKCNSIEYYKGGVKKTLTNKTLTLAEGDFIFLSVANDRLDVVKPANVANKISSEPTAILVGQYAGGQVNIKGSSKKINYNILDVLAKMKTTPVPFQTGSNRVHFMNFDRVSGRRLGVAIMNTHAGTYSGDIKLPDTGYQADGTR